MLPFGCCSLMTGEMNSFYSRMSESLFTLSFKCNGILLADCFLETALDLSGRCNGKFIFPTSNFDVA